LKNAGARADRRPPPDTDATPIEWLLEEDQPAVRYLAQTQLVGASETAPEVRATRSRRTATGWARDLLEGLGESASGEYQPKYVSSNWKLLVVADLGVTRNDPRIAAACERWIRRWAKDDGGFAPENMKSGHLCTTGNTARALLRFGYGDHPKVRSALDWLVRNQAKLGGWSCFGSGRNLDSWEGMSAFAAFPRSEWTPEMETCVSKAAEFYLSRELYRQGESYPPWFRFHYPVHYYYDLLVGLDFMTELGYGADPRMRFALDALRERRRPDGRWILDAAHPDVEGGIADWFARHPKRRPTPLVMEPSGEPSKMITLRALRVLRRLEER
jgi:hypothetical protein